MNDKLLLISNIIIIYPLAVLFNKRLKFKNIFSLIFTVLLTNILQLHLLEYFLKSNYITFFIFINSILLLFFLLIFQIQNMICIFENKLLSFLFIISFILSYIINEIQYDINLLFILKLFIFTYIAELFLISTK